MRRRAHADSVAVLCSLGMLPPGSARPGRRAPGIKVRVPGVSDSRAGVRSVPSAVWSARCHLGWWACVKSVAGDVRQRRVAAATGRQLVTTASADLRLRWLAGVAFRGGAGDGGKRAGWLDISRCRRSCNPQDSTVSRTCHLPGTKPILSTCASRTRSRAPDT